jgi:hypothetical protein
MPFQNCNFIKQSDHRPCEHQVFTHPDTVPPNRIHCGMHAPIAARLPPVVAGQCEHIIGTGRNQHWCARANAENERLCARHVIVREAEAVVAAQVAANRQARFRQAMADARAAAEARHAAAPPPPPGGGGYYGGAPPPHQVPVLQRIATDTQSVHTAAVTRQTNEGEKKLLAEKGDGRQVGLRIARVFAARHGQFHSFMRVMNDIDHWYSQQNCRQHGDRLYSRVLEGLYHTIMRQPETTRKELFNRLWEEASESVGMCCEGHISRLVNVMVGFDEAFKPPVSLGEVLQNKMAALAASGSPDAVDQAKAFMTELGVSAQDQAPWLEALA